MTENEALRVVGHLLERNQCTQTYAQSEDGEWVGPLTPYACSWCLVGAIMLVRDKTDARIPYSLVSECVGVKHAARFRLARAWDNADDAGRARIVARLKSAGLE